MSRRIPGARTGRAAVVLVIAATSLGAALWLDARHERTSLAIHLRWIRSYDKETWQNVCTGLLWTLSFLGARLERPQRDVLVRDREDASTFELRLDRAGFDPEARRSLSSLLEAMKGSDEYRAKGALDLGRFVALTLGNPWNYYAITQVPHSYGDFTELHAIDRAELFPVLNSEVARRSRLIRFVVAPSVDRLAFVADELSGTFGKPGVAVTMHEVFDVMPNGQLRFAIYDRSGRLAEGTPIDESQAGKPAKCLWCHESGIEALLRETPNLPGYMTAQAFSAATVRAESVLARYRDGLNALVDYRRTQDHTQAELLYISFMEPSAARLAREWGLDIASVEKKMSAHSTHVYAEFPFLGMLYERRLADAVADYGSLPPPLSIREPNGAEPDNLHYAHQ